MQASNFPARSGLGGGKLSPPKLSIFGDIELGAVTLANFIPDPKSRDLIFKGWCEPAYTVPNLYMEEVWILSEDDQAFSF